MIARGSSAWCGHSHFAKGTSQGNFTRCGCDLIIFITEFILDDSWKRKQGKIKALKLKKTWFSIRVYLLYNRVVFFPSFSIRPSNQSCLVFRHSKRIQCIHSRPQLPKKPTKKVIILDSDHFLRYVNDIGTYIQIVGHGWRQLTQTSDINWLRWPFWFDSRFIGRNGIW